MDKSKLILIIPAMVVLVLIIFHSLRERGPRTTRNFFFWCFVLCYSKEFINSHVPTPEYMSSGFTIFNVPMMVPIGWIIAIYLCWFLADMILSRTKIEGEILPTVAVSCLCIAALSLCIECSGGNVGWWAWNYAVPGLWTEDPVLKMPIKIIGGWATTNLVFMTIFMLFEYSRFKQTKQKALKIGMALFLICSTVGIMATNYTLRAHVVAPLVTLTILGILLYYILRASLKSRSKTRTAAQNKAYADEPDLPRSQRIDAIERIRHKDK